MIPSWDWKSLFMSCCYRQRLFFLHLWRRQLFPVVRTPIKMELSFNAQRLFAWFNWEKYIFSFHGNCKYRLAGNVNSMVKKFWFTFTFFAYNWYRRFLQIIDIDGFWWENHLFHFILACYPFTLVNHLITGCFIKIKHLMQKEFDQLHIPAYHWGNGLPCELVYEIIRSLNVVEYGGRRCDLLLHIGLGVKWNLWQSTILANNIHNYSATDSNLTIFHCIWLFWWHTANGILDCLPLTTGNLLSIGGFLAPILCFRTFL